MFTYRDLEAWQRSLLEGHCRRTTNAYANHVSIALGSLGELQTCLEIGKRLGFLTTGGDAELVTLADTVGRLLYGLHRALEQRIRFPNP